jgi:mono/diheme cytochrome c family protein
MRRLATLFFLPALAVIGAGIVVAAGLVDFSASTSPSPLEERAAQFALNRSIARHAPGKKNPLADSSEATTAGLVLFRAHCVTCHGAPGVDPTEEGASLNPPAPGLTLPRVQGRPDGELYWIVSRGIRMTGMPAFGPSRSEREIWELVAALRRLPQLSDAQKQILGARR